MNTADWTNQTRAERVEAMLNDLLGLIPDHRRKYIESLAIEAQISASVSRGLDMNATSAAEDDQTQEPEDLIDFR